MYVCYMCVERIQSQLNHKISYTITPVSYI